MVRWNRLNAYGWKTVTPLVYRKLSIVTFPRSFTRSIKRLIRSRTPEWLTIRDLFSIGL